MASDVLRQSLNLFLGLETAIDNVAYEVMTSKEVKGKILLLQKAQMFQGKRADGSDIDPPYADLTITYKQEKGAPSDRVTLLDEGDFYRGMDTDIRGESTEVFSRDAKSEGLEFKYDGAGRSVIFGLAPFYMNQLRNFILRDFQAFAKYYFTQINR